MSRKSKRELLQVVTDDVNAAKMSQELKKVEPFDSFSAVYKILIWVGFYKLLKKPKSKLNGIFHEIYRHISFLVALVFNLRHLIYAWEHHKDLDEVLENMMIEIPQINLLIKFLCFNFQSSRIDKINELLHDPIFSGNSAKDEEFLAENKVEMHRLSQMLNIGVSIAGVLWPASYFVKRWTDENASVPAYVPFETKSWKSFSWSVALEVSPLLWVGYGHLALDCVAATYYSQIRVQLKIVKHNLEHLFDTEVISENRLEYKDKLDEKLHRRFAYYVKRYERLLWYSKEVDRLFNFSMSFQFITSSSVICMVIYKMSTTYVLSVPFMFQLILITVLLTQVFLYCYYGNLVCYESQTVDNSIYMSDWSSVSPMFRRQLLIAMTRWSHPIAPKVGGVIPLSLHTFISIVRSSYTLYTVLLTKQN